MTQELLTEARGILKEKGEPNRVKKLDQILENLLISAAHTGALDITPFLVGAFLATPNDELGTVRVLHATKLYKHIPELKQPETAQKLIGRERRVQLQVTNLLDPEDSPVEVMVTIDLPKLVEIGNFFHQRFQASNLTQSPVYQSLKRVLTEL